MNNDLVYYFCKVSKPTIEYILVYIFLFKKFETSQDLTCAKNCLTTACIGKLVNRDAKLSLHPVIVFSLLHANKIECEHV